VRGLPPWALVVLLCGGLLGACTGDPKPEPPGTMAVPTDPRTSHGTDEPQISGRAHLPALTAPMRVARTRWAHSNVPRTVPEPGDSLPSLLDDLPGRALVASYVPRPALGFDGEAIELYGVDGRWRRLALGDLDLPDDGWSGGDTYGAGALSPDGRWWAGPMRGGMFLVDLSDGNMSIGRVLGGSRRALAWFAWSPDSDELRLTLGGRSTRVTVPGMKMQPFPGGDARRTWIFPSILAGGGWLECPSQRRIVDQCTTYGPSGAQVEERSVPEDLRQRWAGPLDEVDGSVFYSLPGDAYGNHRHDWEILRTDAHFRADARLILPAGSEVDGVIGAFDPDTLGLASLSQRMLMAWLVDDQTIVKVLRPGFGSRESQGQDFWDVCYARDLVTVR
jgi:hypothetical protein